MNLEIEVDDSFVDQVVVQALIKSISLQSSLMLSHKKVAKLDWPGIAEYLRDKEILEHLIHVHNYYTLPKDHIDPGNYR